MLTLSAGLLALAACGGDNLSKSPGDPSACAGGCRNLVPGEGNVDGPGASGDLGTGANSGGGGGGNSGGGTTNPPPPPPPSFVDLSGTWNTRYSFDISKYLFGISKISDQLSAIDQVLQGHLHTGFPPLDALIMALIDQYVPSWVKNLVNTLDTMATLFADVRVEGGRLTIAQSAPATRTATTAALSGQESWREFVVMIVDQCRGGRADPSFPACAELHVPVTHDPQHVGPVEVLVMIPNFQGTLQAGAPEADFAFEHREIQVQMQKLIMLIADTAVRVTTPYNSLREALGAAVDCNGLANKAADLAYNSFGDPTIADTVGNVVYTGCNIGLDSLVKLVDGIGVSWDAMRFAQKGHAVEPASSVDQRGSFLQTISTPHTIDGRFRLGASTAMRGSWEGTR